jgi:hypothetical protein
MFMKTMTQRLDAILAPARNEMRLAQEQAIERIQQVMVKAEKEVADNTRFMTDEQRVDTAEQELEKAEAHLLSALGSLYKALCYIAPTVNPLNHLAQIKEIKAEVLSKS